MRYQKLTRKNQRALESGAVICEHGVTFERLTNGDGRYSINVMVDGVRIHRVVGLESDGTTRTQAEEYIAKLRSDAKQNRLGLPQGRKVALSFEKVAETYLKRLDEEGGTNLSKKRAQLRLHLVPFFRTVPLSKIRESDVDRYKSVRRAQPAIRGRKKGEGYSYKDSGASKATVNRELAVLSHLMNKAVDWGLIDRRPCRIKRFKEGNGRITYLTTEQVAKLMASAKQDQSSQIYPFIFIALSTSMRMMEVLSIRKEHVSTERRVIYVPEAKAGSREAPITAELAGYLTKYMDGLDPNSPWLFASANPQSKSGHTINIRGPFRRVVDAAGLDPDQIVRHTLRHTAITHLVQAGVDLPTVKRISGHKTLAMVERYAHANGEHIRNAMDMLQEKLKVMS